MNIINGDLLNIHRGVIIHQVNNKHVMGAGIAKAIRERYPQHYTDYCKSQLNMGSLVTTRISDKFGIIGIVAQNGYGRDKHELYTSYLAFRKCCESIAYLHSLNPTVQYYMPKGIGCGYGNGDWKIVSGIIDTYAPFITIIEKA